MGWNSIENNLGMRDFTIKTYNNLLFTLQKQGFEFLQFQDFLNNEGSQKQIVLRHDVDARKENSLQFAKMQHKMGIVGTYYFRMVPQSFDEKLIKEIASLGHEVGYHYEDVSLMAQRHKGTKAQRQKTGNQNSQNATQGKEEEIVKYAIESFVENLEKLRKIVPVNKVCMHGSPMSRWDSRLLWKYYDYHDFGIVAEPYFDIDFSNILYLTDTGRRWNGGVVSVRDKAKGRGQRAEGFKEGVKERVGEGEVLGKYADWKVKPIPGSLMNMTPASLKFQNKYKFRSTSDITKAAERGELPDKIMMTFHPQRWTDKPLPWFKELVWQNIKNVGKYFLIKLRE
jgi:hypothetical protein